MSLIDGDNRRNVVGGRGESAALSDEPVRLGVVDREDGIDARVELNPKRNLAVHGQRVVIAVAGELDGFARIARKQRTVVEPLLYSVAVRAQQVFIERGVLVAAEDACVRQHHVVDQGASVDLRPAEPPWNRKAFERNQHQCARSHAPAPYGPASVRVGQRVVEQDFA